MNRRTGPTARGIRGALSLAVAVALGAAACTGKGAPTAGPAPGPTSPGPTPTLPGPPALDAATMEGELAALLVDQAYLAGWLAAVARDPELGARSRHFREAARAVRDAGQEVERALGALFEGDGGSAVRSVWQEHVRGVVGFARALRPKGGPAPEARSRAEDLPDRLAAALGEGEGSALAPAAEAYAQALASAMAAQRPTDPDRFRALRQAAAQAVRLAAALVEAARRLLPGRIGGEVVPDPSASPIGLRALLVEHAHLTALLTGVAADPRLGAGTRPFSSAAAAVQATAERLGELLGTAFGRDPVTLSELWMDHVRSLAQYAVASARGVPAGAEDARRELRAFPGRWGRALERATGGALSRAEAAEVFEAQVRALLALADLQLERSPGQYRQLARAVQEAERAAAALEPVLGG